MTDIISDIIVKIQDPDIIAGIELPAIQITIIATPFIQVL